MINIFVFTQNLIINSFNKYSSLSDSDDTNIFVTTHFLFENEREVIKSLFPNIMFFTFADFLSDKEMAKCDIDAYTSEDVKYDDYLFNLKKNKNEMVIAKLKGRYPIAKKYILSDDLGIEIGVWKKSGYKWLEGTYYYREKISFLKNVKKYFARCRTLKNIYHHLKGDGGGNDYQVNDVNVAYFNERKYVFIGNLNRIGYRLALSFVTSEEECKRLNSGKYESKDTCTYMTTWHEHGKCKVPDDDRYEVRWAQDGYLPPNYTHKDYFFKPKNVVYYCWDSLGTQLFRNQGLPYEMIPFAKKLYIPDTKFPKTVKTILVVASGSGDWTALKNRSDDDIMVDLIVEMAKSFPDIDFIYRCHPTWVHPLNVGVHSIERVQEYFCWLNLPNLVLSSNIPIMNEGKEGYKYSFPRTSLDDDLKKADFVIGEHSISMIDGAFKGIPFCSVNITGRRNFFVGLNELGFPTCSSSRELKEMIESVTTQDFMDMFNKAVINYNAMTDE